jgi:hypothetical protein
MKRSALSVLFFSLLTAGPAAAAISVAGDLMFTGFNADGTDDVAFVLLNSYDANTVIFFSDNEWNGTAWNDNNETYFQWSSTVSLASGTVITLTSVGSGTLTASTGSAVFNEITGRGLGASNEGLYAYVGSSHDTTAPTFLSAFANSGFTSVATGLLTGTGLTDGSTAAVFTNGADVFAYTGDRTSQTGWSAYSGLIGSTANWVFEDGAGDQHNNSIGPDVSFNTASFAVIPEPATLPLLALLAGPVLLARRRRQKP